LLKAIREQNSNLETIKWLYSENDELQLCIGDNPVAIFKEIVDDPKEEVTVKINTNQICGTIDIKKIMLKLENPKMFTPEEKTGVEYVEDIQQIPKEKPEPQPQITPLKIDLKDEPAQTKQENESLMWSHNRG
jgi:hypothetical protein